MKTKKLLFIFLLVFILVVGSVSFATAQEPQPGDEDDPVAVEVGRVAVLNDTIPIQGRLTNASGNPVPDANYTVVASIYAVNVGGVARCTDSDTVTTVNGLFNMDMDFCTAADINGDALWLGIKVGADAEMTPRREIGSVPYAYNVRPGAILKGADSYLFVPGTMIFKNLSTDSTRWDMSGSSALIYSGNAAGGSRYIFIPITIPAVLYGQPTRITAIAVYYKCHAATSYISQTALYKQTDADTVVSLATDNTDRVSITASSYSLATEALENTLSSSQGSLTLRLYLTFTNNTDYVQIGGVRLTLEHDYATP